ncbi:kunitz-type kappaPI-theraphotoxin-Hs1a [Daphnia magna]|uniref:kunitz-type kappaPI-theraphotoxin-Hs1a n=1 Tax=Daphnia magna TaxID=35525 RepID=UPI001E1BB29B|nr:kunitz-type kappaPI-theraphotoxin-Hs1a [Daphnia magna]XP_045029139.1 kunitz-type kappaPI-theraphotoxin-Hs1a [Daphnia magna]XP_045029140.1 kunitz-type kappaPI-theraphotoxin-Hs1a [Daphnia magna]
MSNLTLINVFIVLSAAIYLVGAEQLNVRVDYGLPTADRPDFCLLPGTLPGEKKCKGYIKKWTFNATEDACVPYIYGGCHGTKNLFDTEEECHAACPSSDQKMSDLPKMQGSVANLSNSASQSLAYQNYLVAILSCLIFFCFMGCYRVLIF